MPKGLEPAVPDCHPDKPHKARGMCSACYGRWQRAGNPEAGRAAWRRWRLRNLDHVTDRQRRYDLGRFGLTPEQYAAMVHQQGGVCAICRQPETFVLRGKVRRLAVDHDRGCCPTTRSCGKCVRALLCAACNAGLGNFHDAPHRLRAAADYLEEHAV